MGSQMPELGSKISVISKADIRYEGRLYQVDPSECTIGLANVRSFGTEDRETHFPVPAQNQIYEYILFRGSDIKDIRVINSTPIHQDPAIVQVVPPAAVQQQSSFQSQVMGGFSYGGVGLGGLQRPLIPQQQQQQPSELGHLSDPQDKDPDLMGGVSRSTTPSLTRKSPTMDQGTQATSPPDKHPKPIQPPHRTDRFQGNRREPQAYQQQQPERETTRASFYDRRPLNNRRDNYDNRNHQNYENRNYENRNQNYENRGHQNYENRNQNYENRGHQNYENRNQNYDNRNHQFHNRQGGPRPMQDQQQRGGWVDRNNQGGGMPQRGRGMGRGRGAPPNRAGAPTPRKKNLLKFESEYDFDKANSEFEELRTKLTKLKVAGEGEVETVAEVEKKEDSGNETGAGEQGEEDEVFYDKQKSFFDTISCEAVERSKGRSQRTDWRAERKLNSETFGVSSARRGMYRGGRGYYGGQRNYGYRPRNPQATQDAPAQPPAAANDALLEKLGEKLAEEKKVIQ